MKKTEDMKKFLAMSPENLVSELDSLKRELMNVRMKKAARQLENSAQLLVVRRRIAQVRTVLQGKAAQA